MTTPGAAALAEAARLESARVYSQLQREHRTEPDRHADRPVGQALDEAIVIERTHGRSVAEIAIRFGIARGVVTETLERLLVSQPLPRQEITASCLQPRSN